MAADHRHAKDVGKILLGALQDLKHIRHELDGSYGAPGGDTAPAAAVVDRCVDPRRFTRLDGSGRARAPRVGARRVSEGGFLVFLFGRGLF